MLSHGLQSSVVGWHWEKTCLLASTMSPRHARPYATNSLIKLQQLDLTTKDGVNHNLWSWHGAFLTHFPWYNVLAVEVGLQDLEATTKGELQRLVEGQTKLWATLDQVKP